MFSRNYSITKLFFLGMVAIALLSATLLWGQWHTGRLRTFNQEISSLQQDYVERRKDLFKQEVDSALDFIRFNRENFEERVKNNLKSRVNEAHQIASHLYATYSGYKSETEIIDLIREALRPIRFNQGRGYFFATDLTGKEILFADHPELEGKNLLDVKDTRGVPIIREMIALTKAQGAGFYRYPWTKPNQVGSSFPKLSYLRYFAPGNFFIGTGEYLDDLEQDTQAEVLKRISDIRFGTDGYIFVLDFTSRMLAHRLKPALVGRRMNDEENPLLRPLFPQMKAISNETGSGFLEYTWPKANNAGQSRKVTYVAQVPEWNWLLGSGFHLDELDDLIAEKQAQLQKNIFSEAAWLVFLLLLIFCCSLLIARSVSRRIQSNIKLFNSFFAKAASSSTLIEPDKVVFTEFDQLAQAANLMIKERSRTEMENQQLEAQLMQKQKLEAIGTLAGGIAHDFNNMLAAIFGNLSLLSLRLEQPDPRRIYIDRLFEAANKAKDLISQILSFSRFSEGQLKRLNLTAAIQESLQLLYSSIPSSVTISTDFTEQPCTILGNSTQIHQVLMNLCNNSAQAMEGGIGNIRLELKILDRQHFSPRQRLISQNDEDIMVLTVSDDGPGITEKNLIKIFDPFFSTKDIGKGTGLGLSVVHRIIDMHQGQIDVTSQPGQGACFQISLPRINGPEGKLKLVNGEQLHQGCGTVLLVDDDHAVLESTTELLQQLGYQVQAFSSAVDALAYLQLNAAELAIMLTDQTMPIMTGFKLITEARKIRPELPIILTTGYSDQIDEQTALEQGIQFLLKPVTLTQMSKTLQELLK
jgi:signal transduction histidine kinase/CheY-like chemotaxis protein